jgi:hypothetical protein
MVLFRTMVLVSGAACGLMAADPFLGKWKLDLAKSKLTGQTILIEEVPGDGYMFKEDEHSDTILADGLDHPTHFGETMSITRKTTEEWDITYKSTDGRVLMNTVWKVSPDGKTLTYTATGTRLNGQKFRNQMIARRVSGTNGLAGTWESTGVNLSAPDDIHIDAYGKDGHIVMFPGRQATIKMKFDGKDYREEGPTVEDGATTSGRRIDERTIETTEKIKGKVVESARATVSADGNVQTIVVTEPGEKNPVVLVYERELTAGR